VSASACKSVDVRFDLADHNSGCAFAPTSLVQGAFDGQKELLVDAIMSHSAVYVKQDIFLTWGTLLQNFLYFKGEVNVFFL